MSKPMFTKSEYLKDVVLDLDDFAENEGNSRECLELLVKEKEKFPKLKATFFAIPYYQNTDNSPFYKEVLNKYNWIEMAIHGWTHETSMECSQWSYEYAKEMIQKAYDMGCFVKVFKAPGWQISKGTYQALDELGFIVADHSVSAYTEPGVENKDRRPKTLKAYTVDHPWMIHGHTWDMSSPDPLYRNGIRQIIQEHGVPWDENSEFHFISELNYD